MHKLGANNRKDNRFYSRSRVWGYKGGSLAQIRHTSSQYIKNVWRDSTQTKAQTSPFHIGDYLRYMNEGHNDMTYLVDVNTNDPDSIK